MKEPNLLRHFSVAPSKILVNSSSALVSQFKSEFFFSGFNFTTIEVVFIPEMIFPLTITSLTSDSNMIFRYASFNHLHPNISIQILFTVFVTFPIVPTRRICLTIKTFFKLVIISIFFLSFIFNLRTQKEKLDVNQHYDILTNNVSRQYLLDVSIVHHHSCNKSETERKDTAQKKTKHSPKLSYTKAQMKKFGFNKLD